ncbi:hypothetical protein [Lachnoclostridium sp.]|uniref:hypothetical protein n=1 Tax=Lachnoclostridium sp. TaxID=2028282 RepID=UPI0028A1A966|nr:hypothetical protein [Lachnoclostridium sp.]
MEQVEERSEVLRRRQREEQREKQTEEETEEQRDQSRNDLEDNGGRPGDKAGTLPRFGESKALHQTFDTKSKSTRYFKGLFGRIIIACFLFLLLFLGRMFSVNVFGQNTDSIIEEVRNNKYVESLEQKLTELFQSDKNDSQIEK